MSRCPFVLGQKKVSLILCRRTRAASKIPGQTPLSWDAPGQNHSLIGKKTVKQNVKNFSFFSKIVISLLFFPFCQSRGCPGIFWDGTGQDVKIPAWPVPWQNVKIPSQPVPWQDFELVSLSLCHGAIKVLLFWLSLFYRARRFPVLMETLMI